MEVDHTADFVVQDAITASKMGDSNCSIRLMVQVHSNCKETSTARYYITTHA